MALTKIGRLVDKGIIKDQTNLGGSAADTDEYLIYDASSDSLKAIAASNVTPNETLITGKDEIAIGTVSGDDVLLIYDTSAGVLKKITKNAFDALTPSFTSVSPSNLLSGDGTGNYTIVVTGSDFDNTATFKLVTDGGTDISLDTVTRDSATQLTGVVAKNKANLTNANEPFDIVITNGNTLSVTSLNQITIDAQPAWSTATGNIGNIYDGGRSGVSFTVAAADPESGGDIVYTLESGSLPAGLSGTSTSSGYVISGTASAVGSNTTSTFTIRAKDVNSNIADREFNIVVYAPTIESFTSSGTFSVPSGVSAVNVLVVAGGGGGAARHGGGGGAGGLIYRPSFPVTPGGTVTVTVGCGGQGGCNPSNPGGTAGQDSVFGTLTAKGGGNVPSDGPGNPGGSGGGGSYNGQPGGTATQPTQPGDSGTYGFGNPGGTGITGINYIGGGGGGAGAAGGTNPNGNRIAGQGGIGRAYTIADGTTSVYYAGGGGGSSSHSGPQPQIGGQGGNGGGGNGGAGGQPGTNIPSTGISGSPGTSNRGGGGGAGSGDVGPQTGGSGGKGIVIVTY